MSSTSTSDDPNKPRIRVPHPHVRVDVATLHGSPHVVGSRVPVRRLWQWHRGGASIASLVARYPQLGWAKVLDALAFAYDNPELIEEDVQREAALHAELERRHSEGLCVGVAPPEGR